MNPQRVQSNNVGRGGRVFLELAGFVDALWQKCDDLIYFFACKNTKDKIG
jgi:hypothetical protein